MSFAPGSPRSVRDIRHNRYESYAEPHIYDRTEYWQRKRERWQAEKDPSTHHDAFANGGLFAGFGQHHSPRPSQQQPTASIPAIGGRGGYREQHSQPYENEQYGGRRDRNALRPPPPPMFPSINSHRAPNYHSDAYSASSSHGGYSGSRSPLMAPAAHPTSYMSGVHDLHGGPTPDEQQQKKEAQRAYQLTLQQQMREKEERKKAEKREADERERREEEEARNYNPFGRGGGGAPMRDNSGHIIANRTQALAQALSPPPNNRSLPAATPTMQRTVHPPPAAAAGYIQTGGRGRVGQRSGDTDAAARQQDERQEWQNSLAQQIEEKASKKRREEEMRREEDRREEERLAKERNRMDEEWKREREKEQQKQRAAQDEQDNKARKAKGDEGLTDYEREQAMKGRKVQPQPSQHNGSMHREEERKETVLSPRYPSTSVTHHHQHIEPHAYSQPRGAPYSYDELERELERLRTDIRHQSDKARERSSENKRQQRQQAGGAFEMGRTKRRQPAAYMDDDDAIARFLNKQNNGWRSQADEMFDEQDDMTELDSDMGSMQLAGNSMFLPISQPVEFDSRLGSPDVQPRQQAKQKRSHPKQQPRQQPSAHLDSAVSIHVLPPPPPVPPAAAVVDERPLPALTKRVSVTAEPAVAEDDSEEELYADDDFVDAADAADSQHEEDEELVAETETETDEQDEGPQPSEYSKIVSDVDLRDDYLEEFVTSEAENDAVAKVAASKTNRRKKWKATTAAEAG